mmetsp:Transcript_1023/g.1779  ORF Transcript_1023/g.1779 Transcript_1023/m.1779 type:complete len:338 (+) Transcript_1023:47-1060(+)
MIHEKQIRQLCAIHSVNNLLQLPSDFGLYEYSDDDNDCDCDADSGRSKDSSVDDIPADEAREEASSSIHEWACHGKILYSSPFQCNPEQSTTNEINKPPKRKWMVATQDEFDDISKEFTLRERMLMEGDESTFLATTSCTEEVKSSGMSQEKLNKKLPMVQKLRSQYGTPFFGNYSLEVIEEALDRRGVELEFYRVPDVTGNTVKAQEDDESDESDANTNLTSSKRLIGFIIYEKEASQRNALSFFSRAGSHIPIVKHFFGVGQHWYAITGVKYKHYKSKNAPNREVENEDSSWSLIDSKQDGITTFEDNEELMDYLREVQHGGGIVFHALMDTNII